MRNNAKQSPRTRESVLLSTAILLTLVMIAIATALGGGSAEAHALGRTASGKAPVETASSAGSGKTKAVVKQATIQQAATDDAASKDGDAAVQDAEDEIVIEVSDGAGANADTGLHTLTDTILTGKGTKRHIVSVTYGDDAGVPYNTGLVVTEGSLDDQRKDALYRALGLTEEQKSLLDLPLNIRLVADGTDVELMAPVEVEIATIAIDPCDSYAVEVARFEDSEAIPLAVENLTGTDAAGQPIEKPEFTRIKVRTNKLGDFSLSKVLAKKYVWSLSNETITIWGPRATRTEFSETVLNEEYADGLTMLRRISAQVDPSSEWASNLWISAELNEGADQSQGAVRCFAMKDGDLDTLLFGMSGRTYPTEMPHGVEYAFLWDDGYRTSVAEAGAVSFFGRMPLDVEVWAEDVYAYYADAEAIVGSGDGITYGYRTVAAFDASFMVYGNAWKPDAAHVVTATIEDAGITANSDLQVWHVDKSGQFVQLPEVGLTDGTVSFAIDDDGTYVLVERVSYVRELVSTDGSTYKVTVTYDKSAGLPNNVQLVVSEVACGTVSYFDYTTQSMRELGIKSKDVGYIKALDIELLDPVTGMRYQPADNVTVRVELLDAVLAPDEAVDVVHFGAKPEVVGAELDGGDVVFEANGFSVYVVVQTTKEQVLTASDGNSYRVAVTYDSYAGIPEDAQLSVYELEAGSEYDSYITMAAERLGVAPEHLDYAHAFGISLVSPQTGEYYQPTKNVTVSIDLLTEAVDEGDSLSVVHFGDEPEVVDCRVNDGLVEFEAEGFSIYIVAKEKLMKHFVFYSPDDDDVYHSVSDQVLVDGEQLVKPADPTRGAAVFRYWATERGGDESKKVSDDTFTTIHINPDDIPGSTDEEKQAWLDDEANYEKFYAVFEANSAVVTFYNQSDQVWKMELVSPKGSLLDLPDYTPIQDKEGSAHIFGGWVDGDGNPVASPYTVTGDIALYPDLIEGHYLYLDVNNGDAADVEEEIVPNGTYATVAASANAVLGKLNGRADKAMPTADGYTFTGWYIRASNSDTKPVFKPNATKDALVVDNTEFAKLLDASHNLPNSPTLYAHWTRADSTAGYTILVWAQNADNATSYDFVNKVDATGTIGDVASTTYGGKNYTEWSNVGDTRAGILGTAGRIERSFPTIRQDGSTVVNIYYSRKKVTINFLRHGSYEETAGNDGTQYGEVSGEYVQLAGAPATGRIAVTDPSHVDEYSYTCDVYEEYTGTDAGEYYVVEANGAYSTSPVSLTYDDATGTWKRDDSTDYEGWVFTKSGAVSSYYSARYAEGTGSFSQTLDEGSGLYGQDQNGSYVELTAYKWTYTPEGGTETPYTGTRYKQKTGADWRIWKSYAGLFGQRLAQEDWPTQEWTWYTDASCSNPVTSVYGFLPTGDSNEINYYANESAAGNVTFVEGTEHTLAFDWNRSGVSNPQAQVHCGEKLSTGEGLSSLPSPSDWEGHHFDGWFKDPGLNTPLTAEEYADLVMPDSDVTYYAKWCTVKNLVVLVPDGGEMPSGQNTRRYVEPSATLAVPSGLTRNYVQVTAGEGEYVYDAVNGRYELAGINGDYSYSAGAYEFEGWYVATLKGSHNKQAIEYSPEEFAYVLEGYEQAIQDGNYTLSATPYSEATSVTEPIVLVAKWKREGVFRVEYDVRDPELPNIDYSDVTAPVDNNEYLGGAKARVLPAVTAPKGYTLDYWYVVGSPDEHYRSNDLVDIDKADENKVVTLTAHYRAYNTGERDTAEFRFLTLTQGSFSNFDPKNPVYDEEDPYEVQRISKGEELLTPNNPEAPDGYVFRGWFYDKAGNYPFRGFGTINNAVNTILYARFEKTVTINYYLTEIVDNSYTTNEKVLASQSYSAGDTLDTRQVTHPVDEDHYVVAWVAGYDNWVSYKSGASVEDQYVFDYKSKSDKSVPESYPNLYAVLQEREYVQFDSCGGTFVETQEIPSNGIPVRPTEPTKDGFEFAGWFPLESGGTEYNFDKSLYEVPDFYDTLYAHWTVNSSAQGSLHVLFWVQTADRPEDAAAAASDTNCYQMLYSVDLNDCVPYGEHSWDEAFLKEQLGEFVTGEQYDLVKTVETARKDTNNNGAVNAFVEDALGYKGNNADILHYYKPEENIDKLNRYFEFNGEKSDTNVTVDGSGDAVMNIRFDLKTFRMEFKSNFGSSNTAYAEIHYQGNTYTRTSYSRYGFDIWLNRKIPQLWPVAVTTAPSSDDSAYMIWHDAATHSFYSWDIANEQVVTGLSGSNLQTTTKTVLHRIPINLADRMLVETVITSGTEQGGVKTLTLTPNRYTTKNLPPETAIIHYLIRDGRKAVYTELTELKTSLQVKARPKTITHPNDYTSENRSENLGAGYYAVPMSKCNIHTTDDDSSMKTLGTENFHAGVKYAYNDSSLEPASIYGYTVIDNETAHDGDLLNAEGTAQDDGKVDGKNIAPLYNLIFSRIGRAQAICDTSDPTYTSYFANHPDQYEAGVYNFYFYYKPNSYTVKLYLDPATRYESSKVITAYYGETLSDVLSINGIGKPADADIPAAYKYGYEFAGWSTSPYQSSEDADARNTSMPAYNLTLYAIWKPKPYTVTTVHINAEDGSATYTGSYGQRLRELRIPNPRIDGKLFKSWQKVTGSTATDITGMYVITEDITIQPRWDVLSTWNVEYHSKKDNETGEVSGTVPTDSNAYVVGAKAVVKDGNGLYISRTDVDGNAYKAKFAYWVDGSGNRYYPYDTCQSSGKLDLYAVYSSYRETVLYYDGNAPTGTTATFVLDDGTGAAYTGTYEDGRVKVSYRDWIRTDYNKDKDKIPNQESIIGQDHNGTKFTVKCADDSAAFLGWTTDKSLTAPTCYNGDRVFVNTLNSSSNVLYATWGICKVVDKNDTEHPFATIQDAVDFINTTDLLEVAKTGTIQMLLDYNLASQSCAVSIPTDCTVTLTTANVKAKLPKGQKLAFAPTFRVGHGRTADDDEKTAVIRRGDDGKSLFTVEGSGKLILKGVILDGNGGAYSCNDGDGGLVNVSGGELEVLSGCVLRNSKSGEKGGAVYVGAGARATFKDVTVTGSSSTSGGAIAVGDSSARLHFGGKTVVYDNVDASGNQKNVWLNQALNTTSIINTTADGLDENSHIGVYVTANHDTDEPYKSHGKSGQDFATNGTAATAEANPQCFTNDRHGYVGELNDAEGSNLIRWQGSICKITNARTGALLYYKNDSSSVRGPAVFQDLQSAFDNLGNLYTTDTYADENKYSPVEATPVKIEMLVKDYPLSASSTTINPTQDYFVTLTTAKRADEDGYNNDGYPYKGKQGTTAAINRGICAAQMFQMTGSMHLSLEKITVDGKNVSVNGDGALFQVDSGTLTLSTDASLMGGAATGNGGGIAIKTNSASLAMTGGSIASCAAAKGGAVYLGGNMTMTGGTITNCSSTNGGAVDFLGVATDQGQLKLSGSPTIYNNLDADGKQRNIYIADITSATSETTLNKILVDGQLQDSAAVGVYAPTGNDNAEQFFGKYADGYGNQEAFNIFVNDKFGYLVGEDGTSGKLRWTGVICKIVDKSGVEHVFPTLKEALTHSRNHNDDYVNGICTIQMLKDYDLPLAGENGNASAKGVVQINEANDKIVLTTAGTKDTAPKGEKYYYNITRGDAEKAKAIIKRIDKYKAYSMFTVTNGAALTTNNIIFDGGATLNTEGIDVKAKEWAFGGVQKPTVSGGIVNVATSCSLTVGAGTTMRNSCVTNQPGGAIYAAVGTLAIAGDENVGADSVRFECCSARGGGAVAIGDSTTVVEDSAMPTSLSNCTFSYCHSASSSDNDLYAGGAVRTSALRMTLTNCAFEYCSAVSQGGAYYQGVYQHEDAAVSFTATGCRFEQCHAGSDGVERAAGAFETQAQMASVSNSAFINCSSTKNAGAINVYREDKKTYTPFVSSDLIITGSTFTNCHAKTNAKDKYGDGGAIRNNGNSTRVEDCTITNCYATRGGAVFSGAEATIINTQIDNCWATKAGGGVFVDQKLLTINNGTKELRNCYAPQGGGVYLGGSNNNAKFEFSSGKIYDCAAVQTGLSESGTCSLSNSTDANIKGGGVYLGQGTLSLMGGTISGCKAVSSGGGVYMAGGAFEYSSGMIEHCSAPKGGGVCVDNNNATMTISQNGNAIVDCKAVTVSVVSNALTADESPADKQYGGGVYLAGGTLKITKSNAAILACKAWQGGGVFLDKNAKEADVYGRIGSNEPGKGNEAQHGGGIYQSGGTLKIQSSASITGNKADGKGGGIFLGENGSSNSKFYLYGKVDNNSAANGGGIYQNKGELEIESGVTVTGNTANGGNGGGVYLGGGDLTILGGNLRSNAATTGTATVTTNTKIGCGGGVYLGGGTFTFTSGNVGGAIPADGNTAVNGGGIYQLGGTMNINGGNIRCNSAQSMGGGVYLGGGTFSLSKGDIGGLTEAEAPIGANTAQFGGGLYVANGKSASDANLTKATLQGGRIAGNEATSVEGGGGIAIGGANVRLYFGGDIQVWGNTIPTPTPSDEHPDPSNQCDVCLSVHSNEVIRTTSQGLNDDARIGVYVPDTTLKPPTSEGDDTLFRAHGKAKKRFGTFDNGNNLNRFINNRNGVNYQHYEAYYGVRKPGDTEQGIYWVSYVCKIVDANDKLLYTNRTKTAPALYQYLGTDGAFAALTKYFYTDKGVRTTPAKVVMLVDEYDLKWSDTVTLPANMSITLTMPANPETDGDYNGSKDAQFSTIRRGSCTKSMFTTGAGSELKLERIHVDGGAMFDESGSVTSGEVSLDGALIKASGNVVLGDKATLMNSATTTNGGAIYLAGTSSLTMDSGSSIERCKAANGAVLAANGKAVDYTMNDGASIKDCKATNGLVYMIAGTLNLKSPLYGKAGASGTPASNVSGCTSEYGGLAYVNGGTLQVKNTIYGFTANVDGGAVYVNAGTMKIDNLDAALISNNEAKNNGGGVYVNNGTFTFRNGSVTNNRAKVGGGIFVNSGSMSMNGWRSDSQTESAHPRVTNNVATEKGGGIAVGSDSAKLTFTNLVTVDGNTMPDPTDTSETVDCNVYLDRDSTDVICLGTYLNGNSTIGVYVSDDAAGADTVYKKHGMTGMPFGSWTREDGTTPNYPKRFINDRVGFLYGVAKQDHKLYWVEFVCKITTPGETKEQTRLLYKLRDGKYEPAVYSRLGAGSGSGYYHSDYAFNALLGSSSNDDQKLYTKEDDGTYKPYTTNDYWIQMLVENYEWKYYINVNKKVTLTTASTAADEWGFHYTGDDAHPYATITRSASPNSNSVNSSMFTVRGELILKDIVLDGNSTTVSDPGAIIQLKNDNNKSYKLTIGENASLLNGHTSGNGGAVYADKASQTINVTGGTIKGCRANKGGGIYAGSGVTINLSGSIDFGGTGEEDGSLTSAADKGNYVLYSTTGEDTYYVYTTDDKGKPTNGGKVYPVEDEKYLIRQDIYLAGSGTPLGTLNVVGKLTDPADSAKVMPAGTIWVWAEHENHYEESKQFALVNGTYSAQATAQELEEVFKAFRNSQADGITKNPNESQYLYGIKSDSNELQIVWGTDPTGKRRVILKKVGSSNKPLNGAEFKLYKGSRVIDQPKSLQSGVIYIGELDYGVYYLEETKAPTDDDEDYSENVNKWFCVLVDEDGVWMSESGHDTAEEAKADAESVKAATE